MRQQYSLVCLLLLCISEYQTQDSSTTIVPTTITMPPPTTTMAPTTVTFPDWNGDPKLCEINRPIPPSPLPRPPFPKFPNKAEFAIERVEIKHILNTTLPSVLTLYEYIYDYDANILIMVKNTNGFLEAQYYYYGKLLKSTYFGRDFCSVTEIPTEKDMDGGSAIKLADGTWHVRPLNEFLLFATDDPMRPPVIPVYLGQDTVRGIPVDKWQTCYINKTEYRTVRRIWTFAQQNYSMPSGPVGEYAVPIQALISASIDLPDTTQIAEFDEVYNVYSYRTGIMESSDALSPPQGVFCDSGPGQQLISLSDANVRWPNRFSVRVDASSSRSSQWQRFHLRYDQGREGGSRRLRYDFMPTGAEDFESVIHDYADDLTYTIDRRVGTCKIDRGTAIPDVNPIRDPIRFFIKNEAKFIYSPPEKKWESNGYRSCRGNTVQCTILTTSIDKFPVVIESDTGVPTGETWEATNIEYGWSVRAPTALPPTNRSKEFDYPVNLYLKMYRYQDPTNPSPLNIRTEDVEYEFYEMSHERHRYDFDTSLCYRALGLEYLHATFILKLNKGNIIDDNHVDRRALEGSIHYNLINLMQIKYQRIADLEVDHEHVSNDVTVFFTILGQTPNPGTPSGVIDSEKTAAQANNDLKRAIDAGEYKFTMDVYGTEVEFQAASGSLKASKLYMSSHAAGEQELTQHYTGGSQALAVIVGLLIGVIVGVIIIIAVNRVVLKKPMPSLPTSNSLPNISFRSKKTTAPSDDTSKA